MSSETTPSSADIIIVGGAVMGSSVAYHLAKDPAFKGRVIVIEKDSTYQFSASLCQRLLYASNFQVQ